MKAQLFLSKFSTAFILSIALISCQPSTFYQIYKTEIAESDNNSNQNLIFQDDSVSFQYDFWSPNGNSGYIIQNNSSQNVYVNLEKSFYVRNGYPTPLFRNREFTSSKGGKIVDAKATSNEFAYLLGTNYTNNSRSNYSSVEAASFSSVSVAESKTLIIPPDCFIKVRGFAISPSLLADCDIPMAPKRGDEKMKKYDEESTPISFSNIIEYRIEDDIFTTKHSFYVSEMGVRNESSVMTTDDTGPCGEEYVYPKEILENQGSDFFYIKFEEFR